MPRIAVPEIEDLEACPPVLRNSITGLLRVAGDFMGVSDVAAPLACEALDAIGSDRLVDLCSGSGGPVASLVKTLERDHGRSVKVTLTDKFPNHGALARAMAELPGRVEARFESTDATAVPEGLVGVRTIFNAFHHLPPPVAKAVLANAVASRQPILVFEFVARTPDALVAVAFGPLLAWFGMPLVRPVSPLALALTYGIPVVQAAVLWDGLASCMRAYSVEELEEMVADLRSPGYQFRIEQRRVPNRPTRVTCLVGIPVSR